MTPTSDLDHIRGLEERAFNAWPALQTVLADGWVLRFAAGYTKRANSINALTPSTSIDAVLPVAAPLYARQGLPLIARLSPLAGDGADATLAGLGWRRLDETIVMTARLGQSFTPDPAVAIAAMPDRIWSDGFADANSVATRHRATHDLMLAAIRCPSAFAYLADNGTALAWGLGVAERGWVGLFDVVTAATARRQGTARRLVTSLLAWGPQYGAHSAYLQVVASNAPAIALYRSLGFVEAYRYHYRMAP